MPNIQFQFRRGTAAEWTSANPTLASGEMGIETDTNLFKLGNGSTSWTSLAYGGIQGVGYANVTSTSSLTIGTGNKTIITSRTALATAFTPGNRVRIWNTSTPTNYMEGNLTSFSGTTMIASVDYTSGSGTYSTWTITLTGAIGATGPQGATGLTGATGVAGAAGSTGATGSFSGTTSIPIVTTNATASTSTGTGALIVTGGAGISGNLYVNAIYTDNRYYANGSPFLGGGGGGGGGAGYTNLDGGTPESVFGGITGVDGGGVT